MSDETVNDEDSPSRANMAVALWAAGLTYSEIADRLGYSSPHKARNAVETAVASTADESTKDQLRTKMHTRYERLLRAVWSKALNTKSDEQLAAVRVAADLMSRHAKLFGLDAPTEVAIYTPSAVELEAWVDSQTESLRGHLPVEADVVVGELEEAG